MTKPFVAITVRRVDRSTWRRETNRDPSLVRRPAFGLTMPHA
jgi:hypothetical protein